MNTKYPRQVKIIRDARRAMGYSQQQVATIIGVHVRQYQRIECGERDIRYASMKLGLSICAVLGIDPLMLVFGGGFRPLKINEENFQDHYQVRQPFCPEPAGLYAEHYAARLSSHLL